MPVNTIELPRELREVVDAFILKDPGREHGGFLFGTPLRFETFLPVPNVSNTPKNKYEVPGNWQDYTKIFADVTGASVVAHVHTHPSHSIPSGQDVKASDYWTERMPYTVLIAPNVEAHKTTWWILDKRFEVQELMEVDDALEAASLLFARRFGFASLGPVLMDATGQLRAQGRIPQTFLVSPDARTLYTAMLGKRSSTKKELQELSGLSLARTTYALEQLQEAGLVELPSYSYYPYKVTDIFGRRFD